MVVTSPAHSASPVDAVLHTHRIVAYSDDARIGHYLLVQLGDTGPKGVHGVQTVQLRYYGVSFTAGRSDVTAVQFPNSATLRNVALFGRVAHVTGALLHVGDTWDIVITYVPGYLAVNRVTVVVQRAGHTVLFAPFGGGDVPYISVK